MPVAASQPVKGRHGCQAAGGAAGTAAPVVTQLRAMPWQRPAETPPQRTDFLSLVCVSAQDCSGRDWQEVGFDLGAQQELRAFLTQCGQLGDSWEASQQQLEGLFSSPSGLDGATLCAAAQAACSCGVKQPQFWHCSAVKQPHSSI